MGKSIRSASVGIRHIVCLSAGLKGGSYSAVWIPALHETICVGLVLPSFLHLVLVLSLFLEKVDFSVLKLEESSFGRVLRYILSL